MNKIIFTEEFCQPENLHPFTLTRQIQDIRVGILTIREKWEKMLGLDSFDKKEDDYKDLDRSVNIDEAVGSGVCYMIHGNVLPTPKLVRLTKKLNDGEFIAAHGSEGIVFCFTNKQIIDKHRIVVKRAITIKEDIKKVQYPWDIFNLNDWAIRQDFELLTHKKRSQPISKTNRVIKRSNIFLEKGVRMEYCTINASAGPVYIGKNTEIMEGSMIRGPFALGEGSLVKMGSRIYGATSAGPRCLLGGEIKNSVFFGHSNKAHDGYIGDSVIGEWCNLGAGTTNSNLKNNAGEVRMWTPKGLMNAGKKCGVMIGDFSRTAINTSLTTGAVIGVSANVFGSGLVPAYVPSFSWGSEGIKRYEFDKALADIDAWMDLKERKMDANNRSILEYIYNNY